MHAMVTRLLLVSSVQCISISGRSPGRRLAARIGGRLPGRSSAKNFSGRLLSGVIRLLLIT